MTKQNYIYCSFGAKQVGVLSMANATNTTVIYLDDYKPLDYVINNVYLHFDLKDDYTIVNTILHLERASKTGAKTSPLVLNGEKMELISVYLDGHELPKGKYKVNAETLTIFELPDQCILETSVRIKPQENKALTGLYTSRGNYCTQCEAQGFRRITYFPDRPDVLTRFTTTITADKERYPVLLSNGNRIDQKDLGDGRYWVKWEDPSLKPCYLFALVAGDYECLQDSFITMSDREIALEIYVEKGNVDQAAHAMDSLKRAMKWDEETYHREYDLNIYMIVAVSDFNMGAMENKGLNIFNDKYILARPDTATDADYVGIQSVIGHEYFHNWSGNRVTVRDWFQITLKEGLTIFRDQNFTADMTSQAVKRINDVQVIRNSQFAQDAGPMSHPIRPKSYIEINNFYTVTVYNKGSEVIRMIQTIIGENKFKQAMNEYFKRFDGKAVTTEDFVDVMEEVGGVDLTQFRRWYDEAGTPVVDVSSEYNEKDKTFSLHITQSKKEPFHIPLTVGLVNENGDDIPLIISGDEKNKRPSVLNVTEKKQSFTFEKVKTKPIPSLLRHFSAPVKLHYPYSDEELIFLMGNDSDGFNRWDAAQQYACRVMFKLIAEHQKGNDISVPYEFANAYASVLENPSLEKSFITEIISLPSPAYLIELMDVADVDAIYYVREVLKRDLANRLQEHFAEFYKDNQENGLYKLDAESMGRRSLKNICLWYLAALDDSDIWDMCYQQFLTANNLTDVMGALIALKDIECAERSQMYEEFFEGRKNNPLLLDKWFAIQATSTLPQTLDKVKLLMNNSFFDIKNPNRVYSLLVAFANNNYLHFHQADGAGYHFVGEQVLNIDKFNPQVAARLVDPLIRWRKFDAHRQALMRKQLQHMASVKTLSSDVYEKVSKALG